MKWYVLRFASSRYTPVFKFLTLNKITWFCPMKNCIYRRPDQSSIRTRQIPAFPGYLFVEMDFNEVHPEKLAAFQHIYGLVTFCSEPVPVPPKIMETILKWNWEEGTPVLRGKKNIPHRFAEILGMEEPLKRSFALLNYLTESYSKSQKEAEHEA